VAAAAPEAIKWFQLYIYKDRNLTESLVRRAELAGFKALVLTVDAPLFGLRRADLRNKFSMPQHLTLANFHHQVSSMGGKNYATNPTNCFSSIYRWNSGFNL